MHDTTPKAPTIALRIPGDWSHPGELLERLPSGFRLTPESLFLPDQAEIEFIPMPPDKQFAEIFKTACRRDPQPQELAIVSRYTVNVGLCGQGGSLKAAHTMMQAGAAILRAGGAGVFIDNSAMAHGRDDWLRMADDGSPDAISFAFTSIVRGREKVYTMGMQTMGLPDLQMRPFVDDEQGEALVEIIRYACSSGRPIGNGHIIADEDGPRFQVVAVTQDQFDSQSPMHNPYGCLKIASMKDLAEGN